MKKEKIIIYTDGSARGNPGKAGWGVIVLSLWNDKLKIKNKKLKVMELGGASKYATNNQMELTAPIEALKYLKKIKVSNSIEIFSDSKYVILGITDWIFNWQKNNWKNTAKKPVLNKKLWEKLYELSKGFKIKWTYIEGHKGNKYNERADEIATNFADGNKIKLEKEK